MNFTKINNIVGWVVFLIAAFVYVSTVEPSTSLWDCGEYITTSYKLEIGHPPGAPLFMMLGRVFSAFSSPEDAAYMVNVLSAISSALAILFLFWSITHFAKKIVASTTEGYTQSSIIAIMASGVVGALSYTFSDTFWFSAVEGEVYGMSSFFTALTFWAILKWEDSHTSVHSDRWLILIVYLIGLAIGVHLLNLLVIPAVCFIFYFKKYDFSIKGFLITGVISIIGLGLINSVLVSSIVSIAAAFERVFTNSFGAGFNVGTAVFFITVFAVAGHFIRVAHTKQNRILHVGVMSFLVFIIGFCSFAMIMIRSNANPPLDENDPETLPSLSSYLNREQYGDWSLSYGGYWNSPQGKESTGEIESRKYFKAFVINDKGVEKSFKTKFDANNYIAKNNLQPNSFEEKYIVTSETEGSRYPQQYKEKGYYTVLPRMFDPRPEKVQGYMFWSNYKGDKSKPAPGKKPGDADYYIPTFGENLTYMFNYQLGWMYWRYFLWNFAGRQNDLQGHGYDYNDGMFYRGSLARGNWISGINFIDKERVGDQDNLPSTISEDKGYNKYFYIPIILGLIGFVFQFIKNPKDLFSLSMLFLFTGIAIRLYLNERPEEPRERDYSVAASFYVFAIWIGLGVLALYQWGKTLSFQDYKKGLIGAAVAAVLFTAADAFNGGGMAFGYSIIYISIVGLGMVGVSMLIHKYANNSTVLVSFVSLIGLSSPYLLGSENWDDHDRSGRYFARDIAHNYLGTCDKNAILFCFGDNDTFPLWFAQEVEGYRTDMKVINYSLLSSDWHYSQMKRATYDAPAVETTLEEPDYRAGTRDYVFLGDDQRTISAKDFMLFMKSGKDMQTNPQYAKNGYGSMPFRSVFINVDKEAALKNNLVRPEQANQMVDRLEWILSGGGISKADIAMIDLLANYKWDRPIYFTSSIIQGANRDLSYYLQQEGMAAKLVPIRNSNINVPAIDKDKMYELLVGGGYDMDKKKDGKGERFEWGRLNQKEVYSDYYTLRMVRSGRQHFTQLAYEYLNDIVRLESNPTDTNATNSTTVENLKKKVVEVLDVHFAEMPIDNVPLDDASLRLARIYYQVDDSIKGKKHCGEHAKLVDENIVYFANQSDDYIEEMILQLGDFLNMFEELAQVDASFDYKIYNPNTYNKLGDRIQKLMAKNANFSRTLYGNIIQASQSRGRVPLILPYNFIKEKLPNLLQQ